MATGQSTQGRPYAIYDDAALQEAYAYAHIGMQDDPHNADIYRGEIKMLDEEIEHRKKERSICS